MRRRGLLISAIALVAVLAVAFVGYNVLGQHMRGDDPAASAETVEPEPEVAGPDAGAASEEAAPQLADFDATVYTLDGEPVSLTQIADGKPIVLNFWATWCPYCVQEMPDYLEIYREYGDRVSFAFIDATDGRRETVEIASKWLDDNGFAELPGYYDTDYSAITTLGIISFPTTAVFSADGELVAAGTGAIDPAGMRALLDELA
jgi:thiol-disulfide isomerase/thioredoxin